MADETNEAAVDETGTPADDSIFDTIDPVDGAPAVADEATADAIAEEAAADAAADADDEAAPSEAAGSDGADEVAAEKPVSEAKQRADAIIAQRQVTRRTVVSKRVTPKAGTKVDAGATPVTSKARNAKVTEQIQARYTPPEQTYAKGPSPWWVPAIMFGLLIVGALVIMLNYMGVFGDAENVRLVIGLAFILGGIVTATQYR